MSILNLNILCQFLCCFWGSSRRPQHTAQLSQLFSLQTGENHLAFAFSILIPFGYGYYISA